MRKLTLIMLIAKSQEGASSALQRAKTLDQEGSIELVDYALFRQDQEGHITARKMDDEFSEKVVAADVSIPGAVAGALIGGPAATAAGAAAGALIGLGSLRLVEKLVARERLRGFPIRLEQNSSALAVVTEQRYADQLEAELKKLGQTAHRRVESDEVNEEVHHYEQRLRQVKQHLENLRVQSALGKAELRDRLEDRIDKAEHAIAHFKAHIQNKKHQDQQSWKDIWQGFKETWKELADAFEQTIREHNQSVPRNASGLSGTAIREKGTLGDSKATPDGPEPPNAEEARWGR
jgi:uncharacterized membrane protein